jgi:hypothetical protein
MRAIDEFQNGEAIAVGAARCAKPPPPAIASANQYRMAGARYRAKHIKLNA